MHPRAPWSSGAGVERAVSCGERHWIAPSAPSTPRSFVNKRRNVAYILWPSGIGAHFEQVVSSIPGSVGYISYPMIIAYSLRLRWIPSGFSGYIYSLTQKLCLEKVTH